MSESPMHPRQPDLPTTQVGGPRTVRSLHEVPEHIAKRGEPGIFYFGGRAWRITGPGMFECRSSREPDRWHSVQVEGHRVSCDCWQSIHTGFCIHKQTLPLILRQLLQRKAATGTQPVEP